MKFLRLMFDAVHRIEGEKEKLEFHFSRIYTTRGTQYFVTLSYKGKTIYFHMEKNNGLWRISRAPMPPEWLFQHEEQLAKVIEGLQ